MGTPLLTLRRADHGVWVRGGSHERLIGYFGRIKEAERERNSGKVGTVLTCQV